MSSTTNTKPKVFIKQWLIILIPCLAIIEVLQSHASLRGIRFSLSSCSFCHLRKYYAKKKPLTFDDVVTPVKVPYYEQQQQIYSNQSLLPFNYNNTKNNSNKTLVILTGNLRGGELSWESLYKHVLDLNNADLALILGATPRRYRNASIWDRAMYIWKVSEFDDWIDAMELIPNKAIHWKTSVFGDPTTPNSHRRTNILLGGAKNISGSGAIVFMFRWFASQFIQTYNLTSKYDRFVLSRTDHYYGCPHDLSSLNASKLWIPLGEDWGGICDRHLIANANDILPAMNLLPPILQHPMEYQWILQRGRVNTEIYVKYAWNRSGLWNRVDRFQRVMFVASSPGDNGRWKSSNVKAKVFNKTLKSKYVHEYNSVKYICQSYIQQQLQQQQLKQRAQQQEMQLLQVHNNKTSGSFSIE